MYRNYRIENLIDRYEEAGGVPASFKFLKDGYELTQKNKYPLLVIEDFNNSDFIEIFDSLEDAEIDEFLLLKDSGYTDYLENSGWLVWEDCTIQTPDISLTGTLVN